MIKTGTIFLLLWMWMSIGFAQIIPNKGSPSLQNLLPESYGSPGKIWGITSSSNQILYLAADGGLLEFDGQSWRTFSAYKGFTRAVYAQNDSTIFTGMDMDFGIWKRDDKHQFKYQSLYPFKKVPQKGMNEEFWHVYAQDNEILFISAYHIYVLKNEKITKIPIAQKIVNCFKVEEQIIIQDGKGALFSYEKGKLINFGQIENHQNDQKIISIFKSNGDFVAVSQQKGLFYLNHSKNIDFQVNTFLQKYKVFSFERLGDKYLAFGTILNGIYITTLEGRIIQHINKNKGLPNNTILSMYYAQNGKLWASLDIGLTCVDLQKDISYFNDLSGNFGSGSAALLYHNNFYLGSNQGLYTCQWDLLDGNKEGNPFQLIHGMEGQVWTLKTIDKQLFCGHDHGLFEVIGNSAQQIFSKSGIFAIASFREKYLLLGSYDGIYVLEKINQQYQFLKKIALISGAISQIKILEAADEVWLNIPNYGIVKVKFDAQLYPINRQLYGQQKKSGLPLHILPNVHQIQFTDYAYIYTYNPKNKLFNASKIKKTDSDGSLKNNLLFRPSVLDSNYIFYPLNNGFAFENIKSEKINLRNPIAPLFRKAGFFNNEEEHFLPENGKIKYTFNNVLFRFIVPNAGPISYQYQLENYDSQWSDWTQSNTLRYIALKEGEYHLKLRAKNEHGISPVSDFYFQILAPWYRSIWAYLGYILMLLALIWFAKKYQKGRMRQQKYIMLKKEQLSLRLQTEKHQQDILNRQRLQMEKEQSQLKEEIHQKTIELAQKAKQNSDKHQLLQTLKDIISEAESKPELAKRRWNEMRRLLDSVWEIEDQTFEIQMDELHQKFFKNLKLVYPQLSVYELRLCAYIKLGLNSNEIARICKVLPSSINVSRSRLRKKLNLESQEDLFEWLNQIKI